MAKRRPNKKRVDFRPNRAQPRRQKRLDHQAENIEDLHTYEHVRARGELSRKRTVVDRTEDERPGAGPLHDGTVIEIHGAWVDVDDGERVWQCTIRRVLRTRLISERAPLAVGDRVKFSIISDEAGQFSEAVVEDVYPRRTTLTRSDAQRTHVVAANVDQAVIVTSIREPMIKPHLIDRYLVAAHAGNLDAIVCINKADLDFDDDINFYLERYRRLNYPALATSTATGRGIDELRSLLAGKATLFAGQSGVGKSSLLNAIQPGLNLKTSAVSQSTEKGRHTTTTARWLKLNIGGAVVDTPGIRALEVAMIPLHELEMHFVEFVDRVKDCKFPDCVHIHEDGCAIKAAVEAGDIDPDRYDSYVNLFYELSEVRQRNVGRSET